MRSTDSWTYHVLDWHSSKQSRVSIPSVGAESLAAAEAAGRSLLLTQCLSSIVRKHNLFSRADTRIVRGGVYEVARGKW